MKENFAKHSTSIQGTEWAEKCEDSFIPGGLLLDLNMTT